MIFKEKKYIPETTKIPGKARDYIDNKKFYIILLDLQLL